MRRIVAFAFLAALLSFAALVAEIDRYGLVDRAQPADAIVVLGSQVLPGGRMSGSLARRAAHAAALHRRGLASHVICSGGVGTNPPSEAQAACQRAVALGVPAGAVVLETGSRSTEENAAFTMRLLRERGWTSIILVSDGYHLFRAALMFERLGVTVYASPAQLTGGPMRLEERTVRSAREAVGVLWFGLRAALGIAIR